MCLLVMKSQSAKTAPAATDSNFIPVGCHDTNQNMILNTAVFQHLTCPKRLLDSIFPIAIIQTGKQVWLYTLEIIYIVGHTK